MMGQLSRDLVPHELEDGPAVRSELETELERLKKARKTLPNRRRAAAIKAQLRAMAPA
jgi:hypothetical protein